MNLLVITTGMMEVNRCPIAFLLFRIKHKLAMSELAKKNNLKPIITSLVLSGTVQLTPSGNLIILMRDCQTTGGYPRVLQLKESSINVLSQKFTGNNIIFKMKDYDS